MALPSSLLDNISNVREGNWEGIGLILTDDSHLGHGVEYDPIV